MAAVFTALVLAAVLAAGDGPASAPRAAVRAVLPVSVGVRSCSTFACHGGNGRDGDDRSAYSTWMARDPHARAGITLRSALSAAIETRLAARSQRAPVRAVDDPNCLACHVGPAAARAGGPAVAVLDEGVGCERCHGAASEWLEPHVSPAWAQYSDAARAAKGMTPIRDVTAKATLCASCHVGGGGGDVNHDLIAAGHPRLNFELASYLDTLPHHWDSPRERDTPVASSARLWAIGQVVSARQALALLTERARGARERSTRANATDRPWPEFAEFSCESCHHDLSAHLPAAAGTPGWGTWYFAFTPLLSAPPAVAQPVHDLRRLMGAPTASASEVEQQARTAGNLLGRWLREDVEKLRFDDARVRAQCVAASSADVTRDEPCWDSAAQQALALTALERALAELQRPASAAQQRALTNLRQTVASPFSNGPLAPAGGEFRREFERRLDEYRRLLNADGR